MPKFIPLPVPPVVKATRAFSHPAVAALPDGRWLFTGQRFLESDCYGAPEAAWSPDGGRTWGEPAPIDALHSEPLNDGLQLGVADVRPFLSADGKSVVVIGCDTVYTPHGNIAWDKQAPRPARRVKASYYTVYDIAASAFGPRQMLRDPEVPEGHEWRITCAQVAFTPDGDWLFPCHFRLGDLIDHYGYQSPRFAVRTMQARFVDGALRPVAWGNILRHDIGRGFIEPSLVQFHGKYYLTIRAEDGSAYVAVSDDGLHWPEPQPWVFDDGTPVKTDTTQQHWAVVGDRLYLAYTRDLGTNSHLMRFRAPILLAEVNPDGGPCLVHATEADLFPRKPRDGKDGLLGNFHICSLPDSTAVASDAYIYYQPGTSRSHCDVAITKIAP